MQTHPSLLETLEPRIAPAVLNGNVVTYVDFDSDFVTVVVSKGVFQENQFVFADANGDVIPDPFQFAEAPMQLQRLDILDGSFQDAKLTINVKAAAGIGDGLAPIGHINAREGGIGVDLHSVSVMGDLGRITVGDNNTATPGLGSLKVQTIGAYGLDTQEAGGTLFSIINGTVKSITVAGDVYGGLTVLNGDMNKVRIDGDLAGVGSFTGRLDAVDGEIGKVHIKGDVVGNGNHSGAIVAKNIDSVLINGSVYGASGADSGQILAFGAVNKVTIDGNLIGQDGIGSGTVVAISLGSVSIGGDIVGGGGEVSGRVGALNGDIAKVTVGGSVIGGEGKFSGSIDASETIVKAKIAGSLIGGDGSSSGSISSPAGTAHSLFIGGDVIGSDGPGSGSIFYGDISSKLQINGSIIGGSDESAGSVQAGDLGKFVLGGSLVGGAGPDTGEVSFVNAKSISIGGDIVGGSGSGGGVLLLFDSQSLMIKGSIIGGSAVDTGRMDFGDVGKVTIGGSIVGTSFSNTAYIDGGEVKSFVLKGDLIGGGIAAGGNSIMTSGVIAMASIGKLHIGGSVIAGVNNEPLADLDESGAIRVNGTLNKLTIDGGIRGNETHSVLITALGPTELGLKSYTAFGSISVKGSVAFADILAGYNNAVDPNPVSGSAQIGKVTVGGDWRASNLVAGAEPGPIGFANGNDTPIAPINGNVISSIAKVVVAGSVTGTEYATPFTEHFGFAAPEIGSVSINGNKMFIPGFVPLPIGGSVSNIAIARTV